MSSCDTNGDENKGRKRISLESIAALVVLTAAVSQYSLGAVFDKTGEQIKGGLPLATLALVAGLAVVLLKRRRFLFPVPSWGHIAFLVAASLGLLGLSAWEATGGIKEVIQIGEVFGLSWYLFACCSRKHLNDIIKGLGIIGIVVVLMGIGCVYELQPIMLSEARWAGLQLVSLPFIIYTFRKKTKFLAGVLVLTAVVDGVYLKNGGMVLGIMLLLPVCSWLFVRDRWMCSVAAGSSAAILILTLVIPPGTRGHFSERDGCDHPITAWDSLKPGFDKTYTKRLFVEYAASLKAPTYYPGGGGAGCYKQTINQLQRYSEANVSPVENKIPRDSNSQYLLTLVESGMPAALAMVALLVSVAVGCFLCKTGSSRIAVVIGMAAVAMLYAGVFTTSLGRGIGIWFGAILGVATVLTGRGLSDPKEFLTRFGLPAGCFVITTAVMIGFNRGEKSIEHVSRMNQRLRRLLPFAERYEVESKNEGPGLVIVRSTGVQTTSTASAIRVEGESFIKASGALKKARANGALGGEALVIPLNSGKAVGHADYKVTIPEAGTYRARVQVYWNDGCSNSIRLLTGRSKLKFTSERFMEWHALKSRRTFELTAGDHLITIENVEDGVKLDYFELEKVVK